MTVKQNQNQKYTKRSSDYSSAPLGRRCIQVWRSLSDQAWILEVPPKQRALGNDNTQCNAARPLLQISTLSSLVAVTTVSLSAPPGFVGRSFILISPCISLRVATLPGGHFSTCLLLLLGIAVYTAEEVGSWISTK